MSNECQAITQAIKELSSKVDSYQKDIEQRISKLEKQVSAFDSRIKGIASKINALDQDIKKIIPRVNDNTKRIGNNEKEITKFRSTNKNNQNNKSNKDLQKIKQQITAIERYINALDNAGKQVTTILKRFAKLFSVFN
jgi:chromosome segregation ATPase